MVKKLVAIAFPSSLIAGMALGFYVTTLKQVAPLTQSVSNTNETDRLAYTNDTTSCTLPYEGGLEAHMSQDSEVYVVGCGGVF